MIAVDLMENVNIGEVKKFQKCQVDRKKGVFGQNKRLRLEWLTES